MHPYYEQAGAGNSLVFVHGAFADGRIWDPQWKYFSPNYRLLRYDLRGHGRTGPTQLDRYSIFTFADDLKLLLDSLEIVSPIVCGLSWGGSIAQAFAVKYPGRLKGLVLAGSAVAIDLTLVDKFLCKVLFPKWLMMLTIKTMSVKKFTYFSLWLARLTRGRHWLGRDEATTTYLQQCMLQMDGSEYLKVWEAIYSFSLLPLERITCPTLVINGEHEPKGTYKHTEVLIKRVHRAEAEIIPGSNHGMNLENPQEFNEHLERFIMAVF